MTERFTVDYDITVGNYCLHDDCEAKGVDGYIAYLSDEGRANNLCDLLNEQEETIQHLKAQLEKGNDVCSICKYEYLVASREFYISKCKKEHTECSKGTVDYCEDFELKEKEE